MGAGIMLTPQHPTIIENASVSLNSSETATAEIPSDNAAPVLLAFSYLWSFWKARALCWALCYYQASKGVGGGKHEQSSAARNGRQVCPFVKLLLFKSFARRKNKSGLKKRKQLKLELLDNPPNCLGPLLGLQQTIHNQSFVLLVFWFVSRSSPANTGKGRRALWEKPWVRGEAVLLMLLIYFCCRSTRRPWSQLGYLTHKILDCRTGERKATALSMFYTWRSEHRRE